MAAPRISRLPVGIAIIFIIVIASLWHSRGGDAGQRSLKYLKGKLPLTTRPTFFEIAESYGTDKVTTHHYEQMYEKRLAPFRDRRVKMLEIGLGCGMSYGPGASYYTWLDYFTNLDLYYIEYNAECAKMWANKTEHATIFSGDQASVPFLQEFVAEAGSDWDIIVDDGGHSMDQQRTSLSVLWPHVKPGGIYFIEDLATSYIPSLGGDYNSDNTMMGDLKGMLDDINAVENVPDRSPISKDLVSFEFTQECVALTKRDYSPSGYSGVIYRGRRSQLEVQGSIVRLKHFRAARSLTKQMATQWRKWLYPALWLLVMILFFKKILTSSSIRALNYTLASALGNSSNYTMPHIPHLSLYDYYSSLTNQTQQKTDPNLNEDEMAVNVSTSIKAAVIIETRASANIVPLVLQFSAVLGPSWPVIIYTSGENFGTFSTSAALLRHQRSGRIVVRPLAEGVFFPSWNSVSDFLTTPWLWKDLAPAEHILIFQSDSILCGASVRKVEDFFEYHLIGAPIHPTWGVGYNGGLSLRRRSTILRVLNEWEWAKIPHPRPEDQWYFARMRDLEDREIEEGVEDGIKLPSVEIARTFAVETIDYPNPLGLHQPTRFIGASQRMLSLEEWCPEYRLATTDRIGD
ncbi:8-demethyl-8-alpha-L-rhamnosyl tetracenomycin-C 2'-O-methyltransferase [Lachnellula suecica]|uniref:8-demethyl-8-alpha-L-rhamnosyl tetracenomycin-C 2'-O-methyltransferase n=1 Tax=Lachnellula suecica TaxID=602035 RepID=A0A8T9CFC8_9HELO|nr:8-demethyl-8-alpha-L-rhamnosyl tetracenomycin-C 2'-O-methyltransferase [Lachnellula suecica]